MRVILRSFYSPGIRVVWKAPPHRNRIAAVPPGGGSVKVTRAVDSPVSPHFNLFGPFCSPEDYQYFVNFSIFELIPCLAALYFIEVS